MHIVNFPNKCAPIEFYANILVFVNINPFLYTNNQYALANHYRNNSTDLFAKWFFVDFLKTLASTKLRLKSAEELLVWDLGFDSQLQLCYEKY